MARNGSGTFSIPNTFVSGNTITASGHNQNNTDIASELTNSVAADGQTSMTGPLKAANGTAAAPTLTFASDTDTGAYRSGANEYSVAAGGTRITKVSSAGLDIVSGALLVAGATAYPIPAAAITYAKIQNVTAARLLGNPTGSGAAPSEISLGAGLAFSSTSIVSSLRLEPQGRLTLATGAPVLAAEVSAATAVYYSPYKGDLISIFDGTNFVITTFTELTLTLDANHLASKFYDLFVINDSGTIRLVTGPAWNTLTAGSGARGTGAGTTQLFKQNGLWVNAVSMTARYGASTTTVAAACGTYVGSIFMDGTNGQASCHMTYGQSRKWSIWNCYNRVPIILKMGDSTASWSYTTNTIRQSRADATNTLTTFVGLPECYYDIEFVQRLSPSCSVATSAMQIGIGINSTTVFTGEVGAASIGSASADVAHSSSAKALYKGIAIPIGINAINALERTTNHSVGETYNGTEASMVLSSRYEG